MYVLHEDPASLAPFLREEITLDRIARRGTEGPTAKRIQEWLNLHDLGLAVDSVYGPVTERQVRRFQQSVGLPETGEADETTFAALTAPLVAALRSPLAASRPFGQACVLFATNHLNQHPREVGGDNRGPWVRLYMDGEDGAAWRWCAGFVTFVMKQAAESMNASLPIEGSVSCDVLAHQGKEAGLFTGESTVAPDALVPGSIFLLRKGPDDWYHTGFVIAASHEAYDTLEGNTNDDGNANGYEVCERARGYASTDFIGLP